MSRSELEVTGFLHPDPDTWILHFLLGEGGGRNPLPMNGGRGNPYIHNRTAQQVRATSGYRARQARIPVLGRCEAQLTWWVKSTARTRDADNLADLEKRLFDGLVDADVVVDDKPELMDKPRGVIRALVDADGLVTAPCFTLTVTRLGRAPLLRQSREVEDVPLVNVAPTQPLRPAGPNVPREKSVPRVHTAVADLPIAREVHADLELPPDAGEFGRAITSASETAREGLSRGLRILTVRQPWAWAIIHGGKTVENRVRNVAGGYRGPVAIHVAQQDDDAAFEPEHPMHGMIFAPCPNRASADHNRHHCHWCTQTAPSKYGYKGCIIGVVDLVNVHHCFNALTNFEGCSPWADLDAWHLVLANPRPLAEPIPYRGMLGLRRLDEGTTARVWGAIA